jgi:hypothetical protein
MACRTDLDDLLADGGDSRAHDDILDAASLSGTSSPERGSLPPADHQGSGERAVASFRLARHSRR